MNGVTLTLRLSHAKPRSEEATITEEQDGEVHLDVPLDDGTTLRFTSREEPDVDYVTVDIGRGLGPSWERRESLVLGLHPFVLPAMLPDKWPRMTYLHQVLRGATWVRGADAEIQSDRDEFAIFERRLDATAPTPSFDLTYHPREGAPSEAHPLSSLVELVLRARDDGEGRISRADSGEVLFDAERATEDGTVRAIDWLCDLLYGSSSGR